MFLSRQYVDVKKSDGRYTFDTVFLYIRFATEIIDLGRSLYVGKIFE